MRRDERAAVEARARGFWLPAAGTAVFVSPFLSGVTVFLLASYPVVALVLGIATCAALTWLVARSCLALRHEAAGLAAVAGAVALAVQFSMWSGVS